uniref:Uncharacterized protein n=1 Tax=Populus trichocarpa TaxID=3694 RepID=A0A3N7FF38_POPTR
MISERIRVATFSNPVLWLLWWSGLLELFTG